MSRQTPPNAPLVRLGRALSLVLLASTAVASLASTAAHARPAAKPSPAIFTRSVAPHPGERLSGPPSWRRDLVIRRDGLVTGRDGRHLAPLTPADLRRLNRQLRVTRYVLERPGAVMCTGFPNRMTRIQTNFGGVSWSSPCAAGPHASVHQLELLVRELVAARSAPVLPHPELDPEPILPAPVKGAPAALITCETSSLAPQPGATRLTVFEDGTWARSTSTSHPALRGALTTQEHPELLRRLASVSLAPTEPPPMCAARLDGHAVLATAGLGEYRWSLPCGRPTAPPSRSSPTCAAHPRPLSPPRPRAALPLRLRSRPPQPNARDD